jgi:hypothetical protein
MFIGLAWAGWNEYQKLEVYRRWAEGFERAKFDIYAVLGQQGREVTWGKPTRKGILNLQTFSLEQVRSIRLLADQQPIDLDQPPAKARQVSLLFEREGEAAVQVPFTDLDLAVQWGQFLQKMQQEGMDQSSPKNEDVIS